MSKIIHEKSRNKEIIRKLLLRVKAMQELLESVFDEDELQDI